MKYRLDDITDDILIKILSCEPLKLQYVSVHFYNIINHNNQISNKIIKNIMIVLIYIIMFYQKITALLV